METIFKNYLINKSDKKNDKYNIPKIDHKKRGYDDIVRIVSGDEAQAHTGARGVINKEVKQIKR